MFAYQLKKGQYFSFVGHKIVYKVKSIADPKDNFKMTYAEKGVLKLTTYTSRIRSKRVRLIK